jgi:Putative collagen-binding domain of a collagenase
VLPKRFGRWHDRAVAAVDSERSFALAYLPAARSVLIDVGLLKGPSATARWYDPAGGVFRPAALDRARKGVQELSPPARNAAGFSDWVLLVEAHG